MQKGDKARVINDCEVKAGSEVEVIEKCLYETQEGRLPEIVIDKGIYACYFNGIRVEIAESNLEVIKPKRWLPEIGDEYYYIGDSPIRWKSEWCGYDIDFLRRSTTGVFKTPEESGAMLAKIQALVTSEIGEA